jgi:hypothetical protein
MLERATTFTAFSVPLFRHEHWYAVAKPPWSKRQRSRSAAGRGVAGWAGWAAASASGRVRRPCATAPTHLAQHLAGAVGLAGVLVDDLRRHTAALAVARRVPRSGMPRSHCEGRGVGGSGTLGGGVCDTSDGLFAGSERTVRSADRSKIRTSDSLFRGKHFVRQPFGSVQGQFRRLSVKWHRP